MDCNSKLEDSVTHTILEKIIARNEDIIKKVGKHVVYVFSRYT